MALIINSLYPVNAVDHPSNKGGKPKLVTIESSKVSKAYKELGIVVLKPSIDRLQFGFYPDDKLRKMLQISETDWAKYVEYLSTSLFGEAKYPGADYVHLQKGSWTAKPPYNNYDLHLLFDPGKGCEPIEIQVGPLLKGHALMRFDMNPNRITNDGMKRFWSWLQEILVIPGATISKSDFLRWSRIQQLELAVEILGARPSDLVVKAMASGKEKSTKKHTYNSATGRIETHYPSSAKTNTEYVYDKRQQMLDAGVEPIYGNSRHSRAEFRIKNVVFYKLSNGKNRFKRLGIKALDLASFDKLNYEQKLFVLVAIDRTVEKAAAHLPAELRPKHRAMYTKMMKDVWLPELLWENWQKSLVTSGFVDFDE